MLQMLLLRPPGVAIITMITMIADADTYSADCPSLNINSTVNHCDFKDVAKTVTNKIKTH